jgi:hypothetical protein
MDEPTSWLHHFVGFCDDFLGLAKDLAILLFVVLFFFKGPFLRQKLDDLGVAELGPIKLKEVQNSHEEAKNAASKVSTLQQQIADFEIKLKEVSTRNPAAAKDIDPLKGEVADLKSQASSAEQSLKTTLLSQQEILQKAVPQSVQTEGWIYAGQVDESKKAWSGVGPKNISPAPPAPEFHSGQIFSLAADAYLHSAPPGGTWHAQGEVAAVLKQGDRVQVSDVDMNSHAKSGGWFVWLKVKASK